MKKPLILLVEHDDVQRLQLQSLLLRQASRSLHYLMQTGPSARSGRNAVRIC